MNSPARRIDDKPPTISHYMKVALPIPDLARKCDAPDDAGTREAICLQGDFAVGRSELSAAQHEISSSHFEDIEDYVAHILEVAARALRVARIGLWFFDNDSQVLRLYKTLDGASVGSSRLELPSVGVNPNYLDALRRCAALAIESVLEESQLYVGDDRYIGPTGASSVLDVPIRAFGDCVGVLRHDHVGAERRWTEAEKLFAASVGANVSLALERQEYRRATQERLRANHYDTLTSLVNRIALRERITRALHARDDEVRRALLLLDIDRFRLINEGFGRHEGDAILCEFARRLRDAMPHAEAIARLGNDEFAIFLKVDDLSEAEACAEHVRSRLTSPYAIGERHLTLDASIGIVACSLGYTQAEAMLGDAEVALNRAKRRGKGCTETFKSSMHDVSLRRLNLEGELENAMRRGELVYHYQPIIEMRTGQLRASEALLRWQHPLRGLLPPSQFIDAIAEGGQLSAVGWSLLPEALARLRSWRNSVEFRCDFSMNLNLTGQQLLQPGLVEALTAELARHQLPPSALRIEVTENTLISGQTGLVDILKRLARSGVGIQLDDFGTGFASLRHLSELPLSAVKIDRCFVTPLLSGRKQKSIVESLIGMSHGLGLEVIAEGVENMDQFNLLASLGCDYAQGFLFGEAVPSDRLHGRSGQLTRP